jgi:hypothetical protein
MREAQLSDPFTAADGLQVGRFGSPIHHMKALDESSSAVCLRANDSTNLRNAVDARNVGKLKFVTDR